VYPQIDFTITVRDYTFTRSVDPWGPAKKALSELTEKTWVAHGRVRNEDERSIQWKDRDRPSVAATGELDYGEEEHGFEQGSSHLTSGHRRDGEHDELRSASLEAAKAEEGDEAYSPTDDLMDLSVPGTADSEGEDAYSPPEDPMMT